MNTCHSKQKTMPEHQNPQPACATALNGEPLVKALTIAAHYSVTGRYVLKLAAEGRIPCLRIGPRCVKSPPSEVARALGAGGSGDTDPQAGSPT